LTSADARDPSLIQYRRAFLASVQGEPHLELEVVDVANGDRPPGPDDGRDYFFHIDALEPGLEFDELQPDLTVSFEVKSGPMRGRAGAARMVRRDLATVAPHPAENVWEAPQEPPAGGAAERGGDLEPPPADAPGEPVPPQLGESRS
jgi:cold shock CspA family protein